MTYTLPTQKIAVDLHFEGRDPRRGELFVSDPRRSDRTLTELLESDALFLPFLDNTERAIALVNRADLVRVTMLLTPVITEDPDSLVAARRQRARIEMRDGTILDGKIWYSPPAARSRLSDHLNEPCRFLEFHAHGRLHFIQKTYVLRVLEIAAPPRAVVVR